ncbi:MAG: hypothetical protein C0501_15715, partial [Isosphaera sp.]|nr:hypothetical protein [Isosphaera sp.]
MTVTTITITDPELLAKLAAADGQIIFQGPAGQLVKTVETVAVGKPPPGFKVPVTDEQLAEARKNRAAGRPIGEVIKELKEKYGEW